MEYYLAVKKNKVLIPATVWMGLKNMLNQRSQSRKVTWLMVPLIENGQNRQTRATVGRRSREEEAIVPERRGAWEAAMRVTQHCECS